MNGTDTGKVCSGHRVCVTGIGGGLMERTALCRIKRERQAQTHSKCFVAHNTGPQNMPAAKAATKIRPKRSIARRSGPGLFCRYQRPGLRVRGLGRRVGRSVGRSGARPYERPLSLSLSLPLPARTSDAGGRGYCGCACRGRREAEVRLSAGSLGKEGGGQLIGGRDGLSILGFAAGN